MTLRQAMRVWHLARIGQMIVGSLVCIWIADITPVATVAADTAQHGALLASDRIMEDTSRAA
jgi:hypothetical protein